MVTARSHDAVEHGMNHRSAGRHGGHLRSRGEMQGRKWCPIPGSWIGCADTEVGIQHVVFFIDTLVAISIVEDSDIAFVCAVVLRCWVVLQSKVV